MKQVCSTIIHRHNLLILSRLSVLVKYMTLYRSNNFWSMGSISVSQHVMKFIVSNNYFSSIHQ